MSAIDTKSLVSQDWKIHGSIYRDPDIFAAEMDAIFGRVWVFVGHETEIPVPGDYKTTFIGLQPVIVSRGADDDEVRVMFNRCRHRGSAVCQHEYGNSNFFRCAYHGWTYTNSGALVGVPFQDGYEDLDKEKLGLVHVPRVANYRGFVFASLSSEGPNIEEQLGHARVYLDFLADLGGGIALNAGVQKIVFDGNWKLHLENTIDPYHFGFVHKSYLKLVENRTGKKGGFVREVQHNEEWRSLDLGNGHSAHEYGALGADQKGHGLDIGDMPFNLIIFPNIGFVGAHLRVIRPKAVNRTEVIFHPIMIKDGSSEANAARLRNHEGFYGPAGFGAPDDVEVGFIRVESGLRASSGNDWIVMSRGIHRERVDERGVRIGRSSDEVPQRALYRRWLELMGNSEYRRD
jgi:phenylpropionate dioxygenase-like ring-hydroxylating dioxygenase large terminal subunit